MLQLWGDAALADQIFDLTTAISNTGTTKLQIVPFCTDNQQLKENTTRQNHCLFEKKLGDRENVFWNIFLQSYSLDNHWDEIERYPIDLSRID